MELRNEMPGTPGGESTATFARLKAISQKAADAVGAEHYSISIPSKTRPGHLKIIHSTDADARKVLGKEFPINASLGGNAFTTKTSYLKRRDKIDGKHFDKVDKAAGTHTGQGAMLIIPFVASGRSVGIMQMMKVESGDFNEPDVAIAEGLTSELAQVLFELECRYDQDIPSIANIDERIGSILFCSIRGYSQIASGLPLPTAAQLLNEYYSRLLPCVYRDQGHLEEYLGDGLCVSFLIQDDGASSIHSALNAAFRMQEEFDSILRGWIRAQLPVSEGSVHNIGIATGTVCKGMVGHEKDRRQKVIGPPVNLAAAICEGKRETGGGIYICSESAALVNAGTFQLTPVVVGSVQNAYRVTSI